MRSVQMLSGAAGYPAGPSGTLFVPDAVLPAQLLAPRSQPVPEERLIIAVLADAIDCYWKYRGARSRSGQRLYREAEAWLMAEERAWPFSFRSICETLNIDPTYVRRGLSQWRHRHDRAATTWPCS